ncbi:DNA mismatch repair protein MutS [Bacillus sp. D386]|uniref:DNA mismatch repair protein MutS n=1 Tax=Bacillus sp. D386 TaxID=2587155 RepID=UPI0011248438|nr:DNA mismatch repair protein MutS [Bacillus sp. D386]
MAVATYTPMIQQYLSIKADYQDAFLFFRLGDFYEMFFEDAIKASKELEITLTAKNGGGEQKIPMCGVPYHSAQSYIETLVDRGFKVAICEQTEDPKAAKGVVKREVVQLITPGTVMEGKSLAEKENNYLATISSIDGLGFGVAHIDLTTGENRVTHFSNFKDVLNEVSVIGSKEVVVQPDIGDEKEILLKDRGIVTISYEADSETKDEFNHLVNELPKKDLKHTVARLLNYIQRTQKRTIEHIQPVELYETEQYLKIDYYSKRNLELTETIRSKGKKGSLLWLLDETKTAMGGRRLKQWIERPLVSESEIEARLSMVETFMNQFFEREELRELLHEVYDLERLTGRVSYGNVNARDLLQLKRSLQQVPAIIDVIGRLPIDTAKEIASRMDPCEEVTDLLEQALHENPPISIKEGGIIREGYNEDLDRYRDASKNGKTWIAQLEQKERERTGIRSLKIGYNRVFGYYLEITKANLHLLNDDRYDRKQTLANAERYITPELKEKETIILEAEEKSTGLEYDLFCELRDQIKDYIPRLQKLAMEISELDVLQCFSTISERYHYVKPQFSHTRQMSIRNGRHPVVEKVLKAQEYVPNDCFLDKKKEILLITGPNMSGKSTYMRQVALTAIMAQIGCFVPADEATLPIFDQVFTRIGAADDLISGQSTFMVEMLEANHAITNATENSLLLFDEIGRGTSTYDGMALAQSIIEYIHHHIGAATLFSTHYHELTALSDQLSKLSNVHVRAIEQNGTVIFLHKVVDGPADRSYGIHVAKLAEMPETVIKRAQEILNVLEQGDKQPKPTPPVKTETDAEIVSEQAQLSFFTEDKKEKTTSSSRHSKEWKVAEELKSLSILEMNPLEALNALYALQKKLK